MNDKEYTCSIDKYTIGVDTNGEDGIGMTVAKIENGELHFLGNCYGENARCIDLLIKENQKLKKQLEEYQLQNINLRADIMIQKMAFPNKLIKDKTFYNLYDMSTYEELLVQQKEFIKYLEDEFTKIQNDIEKEIDNNVKYFKVERRQIITEILQKYKEITGVSDEKK